MEELKTRLKTVVDGSKLRLKHYMVDRCNMCVLTVLDSIEREKTIFVDVGYIETEDFEKFIATIDEQDGCLIMPPNALYDIDIAFLLFLRDLSMWSDSVLES